VSEGSSIHKDSYAAYDKVAGRRVYPGAILSAPAAFRFPEDAPALLPGPVGLTNKKKPEQRPERTECYRGEQTLGTASAVFARVFCTPWSRLPHAVAGRLRRIAATCPLAARPARFRTGLTVPDKLLALADDVIE
jgi:hypothetical protein